MTTKTYTAWKDVDGYVNRTGGGSTISSISNAYDNNTTTYGTFDVPAKSTGYIWFDGLAGDLPEGAYITLLDARSKTDRERSSSSAFVEYLNAGYTSGGSFVNLGGASWVNPGSTTQTRDMTDVATPPLIMTDENVAIRCGYANDSSFFSWLRIYDARLRFQYIQADTDKEITSTNWLFPATGVSETSSDGGLDPWTDPDNITSDDTSYASIVEGDETAALMGQDYGIALPADAIPLWLEIDANIISGSSSSLIYQVKKNAGSIDEHGNGDWLQLNSYTKSDLENTGFRAGVAFTGSDDWEIDYIRIRVWYEASIPSAGGGGILIGL